MFLFYFIQFCIRMLQNKPQIVRESIKNHRASSAFINKRALWTLPELKGLRASSVANFWVLGGGGGKTPKCTDKNNIMYLYCASERSERAPQKHIFSGLKIHLHTLSYTINAVSLITYGMALYLTRH